MMKMSVISIGVHDMTLALDFYEGKLGLEVKSKSMYPDLVELIGELPIILWKVENATDSEYLKDASVSIDFEVPSVEEIIRQLKSKGVTLLYDEPQPFPAGLMTALKDPSGNIIEFLEFK